MLKSLRFWALAFLGGVVFVIIAVLSGAFFAFFQSATDNTSESYGGTTGNVRMMKEVMPPSAAPAMMLDTVTQSAPGGAGSIAMPAERMVVRSASVQIVADDVTKTTAAVTAYVEKAKGFVVSASESKDEQERPSASITFRVPSASLNDALAFIHQTAKRVLSQEVSGQDVTEEYVDVQARLKNLRASEDQFTEIMKKATKVEDVLSVQRELERVRGEIESLDGRRKYLETSAALSEVQVAISADASAVPVVTQEETWRPLVVAKDAAGAFLSLLRLLGNVLIWVVVFVPVWGGAYLVWKWRTKSPKRNGRKE